MAMDGVQECAVIGVPDDVWGEAVTAVVVLANGSSLNGDTIVQASKRALGSSKRRSASTWWTRSRARRWARPTSAPSGPSSGEAAGGPSTETESHMA